MRSLFKKRDLINQDQNICKKYQDKSGRIGNFALQNIENNYNLYQTITVILNLSIIWKQ